MYHTRALVLCLAALAALAGCAESDSPDEAAKEAREIALGPADGHDLPATDLERVAAGDLAPDFTARSLAGDAITLSRYRGEKNVVLVFYRGHW